MGSWTLGADNATVHNVPEPGPGSIQARRSIPQLGAIRSIRFDGKSIYHGVTFKAEQRPQRISYNVSYTLSTSKDDASSPGATEAETNVPQNVRNIFDETGEWAHSSFDHRHRLVASGDLPPAVVRRCWTGCRRLLWRLASKRGLLRAVRRAVHGQPWRRPGEYRRRSVAAARPAADPNLPASEHTSGALVRHRCVCAAAPFTFGNAPRNSVIGPGFANLDLAVAKTWNIAGTRQLELRWEVFNALNTTNFDLPNRIFGTAELRTHLQREEARARCNLAPG